MTYTPSFDDLKDALSDMEEDDYRTVHFRDRFNEWAKDNDRPQVNNYRMAQALMKHSCLEWRKTAGYVIWTMTRRSLRCRDWFVGPDYADPGDPLVQTSVQSPPSPGDRVSTNLGTNDRERPGTPVK